MQSKSGNGSSLVFSYLELRTVIGILAIALPIIVPFGAVLFFKAGMQSSISAYYHTGMRDVFVGTLFAIGFFLLSYRGYEREDEIAGDLAFIFAIGLALFPTLPDGAFSSEDRVIGYFHLGFASLLFSSLIYFCLFLFTKTDPSKPPTKKKLQRNKVYRFCGYTMAVCMLLILVHFAFGDKITLPLNNPVYWLQSLAIWAFGASWFVKGEAILKDQE